MNIAVASDDGVSISEHFGRSQCFIVFEVEGNEIREQTVRKNAFTAHAKGECQGGHHDHSHTHSHADIVTALRDCQAVLGHGMEWRAAEEMEKHGIKCFVVEDSCTPSEAVEQYIAGELKGGGGFCRCHE